MDRVSDSARMEIPFNQRIVLMFIWLRAKLNEVGAPCVSVCSGAVESDPS